MMTIRWACVIAVLGCLLGAAGCQSPGKHAMPMGDMKAERPAELNALDNFVGEWTGTSTIKMGGSDESMSGSGTSSMKWDLDKMVLVERGTYTMGEGEDKETMTALGVWTWDAHDGKYHSYWFDSMGSTGNGTSTYDASTKTWRMKAKGYNPMLGQNTVGEGTISFTGDDAMSWTWTEWTNAWKTNKLMEMTGSSRRK